MWHGCYDLGKDLNWSQLATYCSSYQSWSHSQISRMISYGDASNQHNFLRLIVNINKNTIDHNVLEFRLQGFNVDVTAHRHLQVLDQLILCPHVPLDLWLGEVVGVLGDGIVGEMSIPVLDVRVVVIFCWEADIAFAEEPDLGGVQFMYQDPLPYIEFALPDE